MKKTIYFFTKSFLKQVEHNTDKNLHTENLVLIAKELNNADKQLNNADLVLATQSLLNLHEFFGSLTQDLKKIREQISQELFIRIKDKFENHKDLNNVL